METKMGRPIEFNYSELKPLIDEYLLECTDTDEDKETGVKRKVKLPSIEGLCLKLKISKDTLYRWEDLYEDFSDDINILRHLQAEKLLNNGLAGTYNSTIAKVLLTKHGYREGIDQTTNDKDLPTPILGNAILTDNSTKENS